MSQSLSPSQTSLEQAIDRYPLSVDPDTPLAVAIASMNQIGASYALIVEQQKLLGIFTERDVVKITANEMQLEGIAISEVMTENLITLPLAEADNIFSVLALLRSSHIRHLPIMDEHGSLLGVVTPESLRGVLKPTDLLHMRRIAEIMTKTVITAPTTASVFQVVQQMARERKSCVVICPASHYCEAIADKKSLKPVGIITERDIVKFTASGLALAQTRSESVMSCPLLPVHRDATLWYAHQLMQQYCIRRLVVVDDAGYLVGIVTQSTLLHILDPVEMYANVEMMQHTISEQTRELRQLNQQMQQEVAQRQQVEDKLLEAKENLEEQVLARTQELLLANTQLQQEIHDRILAEAEVRRLNIKLEQRVEERTQELAVSHQQLKQEICAKEATARHRQLLEKKLHTSESKIRAVFAAMTNIVLIIDIEKNIEVVPTNTASLYEHKFDIIGHTIKQFFQDEKAAIWWQQIRRTIDTQQTINFDYSLPIDEHEFWFSAYISPMSNNSVIWVARDISDRFLTEEALRQSEEKFARAFRSSPCAITLTSLNDGRHIEVNDSFCKFIGYSREEIIGRSTVELNLWVNLESRAQMFELLTQHGKIHNYEFDFRTKSGKIRTALLSVEVINFYGQDCLISVSQDISDRKLAEAALEKAKFEAEAAKKAADAANQAKSEFLANMSHELRTPLNAILGFSQLMHRSTNLNPEQQENLSIITRSGEHLLTLINQVLDLSKIEAGRLTLNEYNFDLYRLLDDLEDMFRLRAEDKYLQLLFDLSPDVPQYVQTDEVKLRQVLINLLNNAIKFTESGGVSVRVGTTCSNLNSSNNWFCAAPISTEQPVDNLSVYPRSNPFRGVLCFEIEDTGVGIAQEELSNLFKAFVQTRSGKASQEGTGLGLAIARKFVQLMGGDITISSEVGHGSLFKFNIQVNMVDSGDIPTRQPTRQVVAIEPNQPRYRILIVDDRWENRQLLLKLLHPLGFELQEASNGIEALQIWEHWQPHLIWMDMRMPVMDGYEATQQIKATTKGQATAVIALTASTLEEERAIILSAGCDDFMRKPFREADILDTIHKHLGVRYIYDEPTDFQPKLTIITPATVAELPTELLNNLKQAAIRIDMDRIDSLIDEIRPLNPALGEKLTALAVDFKYDDILTLIQQSFP